VTPWKTLLQGLRSVLVLRGSGDYAPTAGAQKRRAG